MAVALRGSAAVPVGNPTTSFTVTIDAAVVADDALFLSVTSRDSTGAGTLAVTDNDTGGNTWTKIGNSTDHKATLWYKRATSASAGKTVTVANTVGSAAGVLKAFSGARATGTPYNDVVVETNASADESHAGFTPTRANSMLCAAVFNYANDNAVTSLSFATAGATTMTEKLSTGGSDCACAFGHVAQTGDPAATGTLTWAQTDGTTYSITWSIEPELNVSGGTISAAAVLFAGAVALNILGATLGGGSTLYAGTVSGAATGTVIACEILSTGWQAKLTVAGFKDGGTYDFGAIDTDVANSKLAFTVVSEGYSTAGVLGTKTRTVYGTRVVQKAYPNQATAEETETGGNVELTIALSDYIYNDDKNGGAGTSGTDPTVSVSAGWYTDNGTGGSGNGNLSVSGLAVTNNSTRDYPKVIGRWAVVPYQRFVSTFDLEAVAFHRFAENGKPVACVKFADGVTTDQYATAMVKSSAEDSLPCYRRTITASDYTDNSVVTCNFTAYPWVGDADAVLTTVGGSSGALTLGPLPLVADPDDDYQKFVAVVDPVSGNNGTGVVSTTYATAAANPFLNFRNAAAALSAASGMGFDGQGGTIYLLQGAHTTSGSGSVTATNSWITVTRAPGASKAGTYFEFAAGQYAATPKLRLYDISLKPLSTSYLGSSGTGYQLWLDHVDIICATQLTNQIFGEHELGYYTHCTSDKLSDPFTDNGVTHLAALIRGCAVTNGRRLNVSAGFGPRCILTTSLHHANAQSGRFATVSATNTVYAYNKDLANPDVSNAQLGLTLPAGDVAIVCNLWEDTGGTNPTQSIYDDGNTQPSDNIILWHNTVAGERSNIGYGETANVARSNFSLKFNAFFRVATKHDVFASNGTFIGAWSVLYGVGWVGNHNESSDANFLPNYFGIRGTRNAAPGYAADQSQTTSGSGGGNYHPAGLSSVLRSKIPDAAGVVIPWDLDGVPYVAGSPAGAYSEPVISGATISGSTLSAGSLALGISGATIASGSVLNAGTVSTGGGPPVVFTSGHHMNQHGLVPGVNSNSLDLSGDDAIVVAVGIWDSAITLSDSAGRTYTLLTPVSNSNGQQYLHLFYCVGITGGSTTWQVGGTAETFCDLQVWGFQNVHDTTPQVQYAQNSEVFPPASGGDDISDIGSITPPVDGCAIVTAYHFDRNDSTAIFSDGTFTVDDQDSASADRFLAGAHKIQSTAAATGAQDWRSLSSNVRTNVVIASFAPGDGSLDPIDGTLAVTEDDDSCCASARGPHATVNTWVDKTPSDWDDTTGGGIVAPGDNFGFSGHPVWHPLYPNVGYVAADYNGLWRTIDFGEHWEKWSDAGNQIEDSKTWFLAIAPDGSEMVIGAGNNTANGWYKKTIKSTGDITTLGKTFTAVSADLGFEPYLMDYHPSDKTKLVASAHENDNCYVSADGGVTFTSIGAVGSTSGAANYCYWGVDPDATIIAIVDGDTASGNGIRRSVWNGTSWGTFTYEQEGRHDHGSHQLLVDRVEELIVCPTAIGTYSSTDDGDTWTLEDSTASASAAKTATRMYSGASYATQGTDPPELRSTTYPSLPAFTSHTAPGWMGIGPRAQAVTFDGENYILLSTHWIYGLGRYVEQETAVTGATISGSTLFAGTVESAQTVSGGTIASGSVLSPGSVATTVSGGTISASQLFAGSAASVVAGATLSGSQLFAGSLAQVIAGPMISASQLFAPSVAHTLSGATIGAASQLFAGAVSHTLTGATLAASQLFAGSVQVAGSISGATIASGSNLFAGSADLSVTGALITGSQLFAGVVSTSNGVTGATITSASQLFAGTVHLGVTGALLGPTGQVYPPGTTPVGTPSSVTLTGIYQPSVTLTGIYATSVTLTGVFRGE